MAKIETYSISTPVVDSDLLLGTDVDANYATKNFSAADLKTYCQANTGAQLAYTMPVTKSDILTIISGGVSSLTIVPAAGANIVIAPISFFIQILGTIPYIGSGTSIEIWGGGTYRIGLVNALFDTSTPRNFMYNQFSTFGSPFNDTVLLPNAPITIKGVLGTAIADAGTSDVTLKITTFYALMSV